MLIDIVAFTALLAISIGLVFAVFGAKGVEGLKTAMIMLNHVYGMLILTWLLGYGLFHFPLYVFTKSFRRFIFYKDVAKMHGIYEAYRDSQVNLYKHCNACRNAIEVIRRGGFSMKMKHQIDMLEESIPQKYDDGIKITENKEIKEFVLNDNMKVNNRTLGK